MPTDQPERFEEMSPDEQADVIADRALEGGFEERSVKDVRRWIAERKASERQGAPTDQSTPAYGMTLGALEVLDALVGYLNGDDDA